MDRKGFAHALMTSGILIIFCAIIGTAFTNPGLTQTEIFIDTWGWFMLAVLLNVVGVLILRGDNEET